MPTCDSPEPRRRSRLVVLAAGALAAAALALPGSASAASEGFCGGVWLPSGWDCRAWNQHWLNVVDGSVASGSYRVCAASATSNGGTMNSNWVCDYGYVAKLLNGRVYGVGALHNGDPSGFQLWGGSQTW